jgi:hypothetical protein
MILCIADMASWPHLGHSLLILYTPFQGQPLLPALDNLAQGDFIDS